MDRVVWLSDDGTAVYSVVLSDGNGHDEHRYRIVRAGEVVGEFRSLHDVASYLALV